MKRHPLLLLLLLLVAAAAVGDRFYPYGIYRQAPHWSEAAVSAQGIVTQLPTVTAHTERCVVRLVGDGSLVQLTLHQPHAKDSLRVSKLHPGDLIAFHALIREPYNLVRKDSLGRVVRQPRLNTMDYAAYLRHQGVVGMAFCRERDYCNLGTYSRLNLREKMLLQRQDIVVSFSRYFEGKPLAIVAAMTLGDKTKIDPATRDLYSKTGASHVLALSGLHLSILYGLLVMLVVRPLQQVGGTGRLRRLLRRIAPLLLLLPLWGFVLLTACPVSLVRAATMLSLMTLLHSVRRNPGAYHALLLTLVIMLVASPAQLFDVGLQLSAVSVAAIIFVSKCIPQPDSDRSPKVWQKCIRAVGMMMVVSFAAQIATMPLVAHYFGRCSFVGVFSSLLVVPAAYVIVLGAFALLLLPPLRPVLAIVLSWTIDTLHRVMEMLSAFPLASVECRLSWWGVAGCYVLLGWLALCTAQRRLGKDRTARLKTLLIAVALALTVILVESIHDIHEAQIERTALLQLSNEKK